MWALSSILPNYPLYQTRNKNALGVLWGGREFNQGTSRVLSDRRVKAEMEFRVEANQTIITAM